MISLRGVVQKIFSSLPPALLLVANSFIFLPSTIYQGNPGEFDVSLQSLLLAYLLPAAIIIVVLVGFAALLPEKWSNFYLALLFGVACLSWIQGNILVWNYGLIGKGDIQWHLYKWRGFIDGAVWTTLLLLAIGAHARLARIAAFASSILLIVQLASTVVISSKKTDMVKPTDNAMKTQLPPKALFDFSAEHNVIHVILDELQSTVFQQIIEDDPSYSSKLEGFTFFPETTGSFPTTLMSIPALLSGQIYHNNVPIPKFIGAVYRGKTIPDVFYENGYEVDLTASLGWYGKMRHTNWYYIPVPYGVTREEHIRVNAVMLLDLAIFRMSPHPLKRLVLQTHPARFFMGLDAIVMSGNNDVTAYDAQRHLAHRDFLQDMIDHMTANRTSPVYKFIHLNTTHWPMVLDNNCSYAGKILPFNWENIRVQAKCSFDHFDRFLDKLKEKGIYDSSLIVFHADHGYWKVPESAHHLPARNMDSGVSGNFRDSEHFAQVVSSSLPLLAIKPPHSKGPLKVSHVQASLSDLPATLSSLAKLRNGFIGTSVFDLDPKLTRKREFRYYEVLNRPKDDYFDHMDAYTITGKALDRASWSLTKPPASRILSGARVDFGQASAARFLKGGWSTGEMAPGQEGTTFQWALGRSASLALVLPRKQAKLAAYVRSPFAPGQQEVTVMVDGKEMGRWTNSGLWTWEPHNITIPPDKKRPEMSIVEFIFSRHLEPSEKDVRPLALLFQTVTIISDN